MGGTVQISTQFRQIDKFRLIIQIFGKFRSYKTVSKESNDQLRNGG